MIKYNNLKAIAKKRLQEARVLHKNGFYDGAAYLCGYVVEAALKARICKHLNITEYPDDGKMKNIFSSHEFDRLLLLSGLSEQLSLSNTKNRDLVQSWSLLTSWKPDRRYIPIGTYSKKEVGALLKALTNRKSGFLTWIKKIW